MRKHSLRNLNITFIRKHNNNNKTFYSSIMTRQINKRNNNYKKDSYFSIMTITQGEKFEIISDSHTTEE